VGITGFQEEPLPIIGPQTTNKISGKSEQGFLSYWMGRLSTWHYIHVHYMASQNLLWGLTKHHCCNQPRKEKIITRNFHQSPPYAHPATGNCTCAIWWYIKLFKIVILGNLPIVHDSLSVLEVMFFRKKIRIWGNFTQYIWCLKFDLGPKSKPFKIFRVNLLKFNNFFNKHDLITPKISLCYQQMVCSAYFIFPLFIFQ
jgi:hypothetical protein